MNDFLANKYPYLSNFFETAIKGNRLFHSLILYGSNSYLQYAMSLELARLLNCLEEKREDCNCRNCKWIRENKHPAVMTVSKIDNKSEKDTSKTVISAQQAQMVLDTVFSASEYHKVIIFCDAEIKELDEQEKREYDEFKQTGFQVPQQTDNEKIWYPTAINQKCFQETTANALLKSIEEPQGNVTFIFLTNTPNDLISTIVSRSQSFYMPYSSINACETEFFDRYFINYPKFDINLALDFVQTLLNYQNEKNLEPVYIIDCIQYYLTEILKANTKNRFLVSKIFRDLKKLQESKKMLKSYVKENQVYEHIAFYFANRVGIY